MTKHQRRWSRAITRWARRMGVPDHIHMVTEHVDEPTDEGHASGFGEVAVTTHSAPQYRQARFEVRRSWLERVDDEELDRVACHEMLHYVLSPILRVFDDAKMGLPSEVREAYVDMMIQANEGVVTDLTAIIRSKK